MATFIKIASVTVGSGGATSMSFTSIPNTYTDLVIKISARGTDNSSNGWNQGAITFNSSTTGYSSKLLLGRGDLSAVSFDGGTSAIDYGFYVSNSVTTSNTFASTDVYIPNYAGSNFKSVSSDTAQENNSLRGIMGFNAGLWSNSAAITSITLERTSTWTFVENTTATLYGISKS